MELAHRNITFFGLFLAVDSFSLCAVTKRSQTFRANTGKRCGLARALSKLGFCSRSQAFEIIRARRVGVNGKIQVDPEFPTRLDSDEISVDGNPLHRNEPVYIMLNKPRGLVTTKADEHGRETVYSCFKGRDLPFLSPVGRLDKASEGLLLFTNDNAWANLIAAPETHVDKTYHVQVNCVAGEELLESLVNGISVDGEFLKAKRASLLRSSERNSWLEIVLDEGKNRHIRRLLDRMGCEVLRLVRVAIGPLTLGQLPKAQFRFLTAEEVRSLG